MSGFQIAPQAQFSYIPLESQGENTPVVVSQLKNLFDMNGVSDVRLEGLKLEHSTSGGEDGYRAVHVDQDRK